MWTRDSLLPIVVGIESVDTGVDSEPGQLTAEFCDQLRAYRAACPHSRFVLLCAARDAALDAYRTAAAELHVEVIDSGSLLNDAGQRPDPGARCHVLFRAPRSRALGEPPRGTQATRPGAPPAAAHGLQLLGIEPETGPRVILLGAAAGAVAAPSPPAAAQGWTVQRVAQSDRNVRALRRTDDFNRLAQLAVRDQPAALNRSSASLALPPGATADPNLKFLSELFAAADTFASLFQAHVHRAFRWIFALATAATVFNGIYQNDAHKNLLRDSLLLSYVLLLVGAYLIYFIAKRRDLHDFFVECRTLAEVVRIQSYWRAAGVPRDAEDSTLFEQRKELIWIRLALAARSITAAGDPLPGGAAPAAAADHERRRIIVTWIETQQAYFSRGYERSSRRVKRTHRVVVGIFLIGAAATGLSMLHEELPWITPYLARVGIATIFFPAIAAAISAFLNKIGLTYQADHYSRMLSIYAAASRRVAEVPLDSMLALGMALGDESLREIGDWAAFRRERSIDEPVSPFKKSW